MLVLHHKRKQSDVSANHFQNDLATQLVKCREEGNRIIVCLDANENVYTKEFGKILMQSEGLNTSKVVGDYRGSQLSPTFFRDRKPIEGMDNKRSTSGECLCNACKFWCRGS